MSSQSSQGGAAQGAQSVKRTMSSQKSRPASAPVAQKKTSPGNGVGPRKPARSV